MVPVSGTYSMGAFITRVCGQGCFRGSFNFTNFKRSSNSEGIYGMCPGGERATRMVESSISELAAVDRALGPFV